MNENRNYERFKLALESRLSAKGRKTETGDRILNLTTENISAGGAFFYTDQSLPVGTELVVDMVLPLDKLKKVKGSHTRVNVEGTVLRTGAGGMAVRFKKNFNILPVATGGKRCVDPSSDAGTTSRRRERKG